MTNLEHARASDAPSGPAPSAAAGEPPAPAAESASGYDTSKGCLLLGILVLISIGLLVAAVLLLGNPRG